MLIGLDGCQDGAKVYHAYNDKEGKTHEFIRNGLVHANRLLGKEAFETEDWEVVGEYDEAAGRHQAFYYPTRDVHFDGIQFLVGERVKVEESYKYSARQAEILWEQAGLVARGAYGDGSGQYCKYAPDSRFAAALFLSQDLASRCIDLDRLVTSCQEDSSL